MFSLYGIEFKTNQHQQIRLCVSKEAASIPKSDTFNLSSEPAVCSPAVRERQGSFVKCLSVDKQYDREQN